jgi:hypothetical protein
MLAQVLGDIVGTSSDGKSCIQLFFDDVCIGADSPRDMMRALKILFDRLSEFNLLIQPEKCLIGSSSCSFIGHQLTEEGISIDPSRLDALLKLRPPRCKKELRSILGTFGFCRRYVRNFSQIVAPMQKLITASYFRWTKEQDDAFDQLKLAIQTAPVLSPINYSLPIVVTCDASILGLGSVLSQIHEGEERVVAFASRALTAAEQNFDNCERELLAVLWAFEKFEPYIAGQSVLLRSDCTGINGLTAKNSKKITRWLMRIRQQPHTLFHIKGSDNVAADLLSRLTPPHPSVSSITSRKEHEDDLRWAHGFNGHWGYHRTLAILKDDGRTWHGMTEDVKHFVENCPSCLKQRTQVPHSSVEVQNIATNLPYQEFALDVCGPFRKDSDGMEFFLVCVDSFSRFCWAQPMKENTSKAIISAFNKVLATTQKPVCVRVDHGSTLTSAEFIKFLDDLKIQYHHTTVARHEANGQAEVMLQHIQRQLRIQVERFYDQGQWSTFLPRIMQWMNWQRSSSTQLAPVDILMPGGRRDHVTLRDLLDDSNSSSADASVDSAIAVMRDALSGIQHKRIASATAEQKKVLQKRMRASPLIPTRFNVGDLVLCRYEHKPPHKLLAKLHGPYEIVAVQNNSVFKLKDPLTPQVFKFVHVSMLVKFSSDQPYDPAYMVSNDKEAYIIDKVLKHETIIKKGSKPSSKLFVSWKWYDNTFDSWIPLQGNVIASTNIELIKYLQENNLKLQRGCVTEK